MSNLRKTNTKLPAKGLVHKRARKSPHLQENYGQKIQFANLPADSQPDPTETLDIGAPTSIAHKLLINLYYILCYIFWGERLL